MTKILVVWFVYLSIVATLGIRDSAAYNPCVDPDPELIQGRFPDGFLWGTASAAYQIEGGWNAGDKGRSIWDTLAHQKPSVFVDNATGDVAADSYHKWKEDVGLLHQLNVSHYRLSLSWPRILPTGLVKDGFNHVGVRYYARLLHELQWRNITAMVTLYHWDLPEALQQKGGWLNPDISRWFKDYAVACFYLFGHLVKYWITINEPYSTATEAYGSGEYAPRIKDLPGKYPYEVAHNQLRAHAEAYSAYQRLFKTEFNGQIGISLSSSSFGLPMDQTKENREAADRFMQFQLGWFAHPIFGKEDDYPKVMKDMIRKRSLAEGRQHSRLPTFTASDRGLLRGSADFFALNHYTSSVVQNRPNDDPRTGNASFERDSETRRLSHFCPNWKGSGSKWLHQVPYGFRGTLKWVKREYGNPPIFITENGLSDNDGRLWDTSRVEFIRNYLNNMLKAIKIDGVNVIGYTYWSVLDNLEWTKGYSQKFGLVYVNFTDPNRPRTPKQSFAYYRSIINKNGMDEETLTLDDVNQDPIIP